MVGAHNALIDAKYTLKLIQLFDLARSGGVEQLEIYAKYLLRGDKVYGDLNGLSSEDRQMIKQLNTLIQSRCKISANNQLDKVIVMLNEKVEDGILDIGFVREKRRYYKNRIKDIDNKKKNLLTGSFYFTVFLA